jgi:molybdopterin synthase catalytic subunit/uncharacterized protein involved in tolerance to divalent cations
LIEITEREISLEEMVQRAKGEGSGAIVTFLGTVRDDGIQMMEVEAFHEAAEAEIDLIRSEAMRSFGLLSAQVVHRTGRLAVGESIVAIVCSAPHRAEAFEGCRYIIDELKRRAPIWKKERGENGERWVEASSGNRDGDVENARPQEMNIESGPYRVVLCTASPQNGEEIAKSLVEEHLAACVNISRVKSCYLWDSKLNLEHEELLIIKTKQSSIERIISRIRELHSYELPEIIVLPITSGYGPYLDWISQSVR